MPSPSKTRLQTWDDAHLWHPFTPHSVYREEDPVLVVAGEGNYLIDYDGRRYLDGAASLWCGLFGHRRRQIDDGVQGAAGMVVQPEGFLHRTAAVARDVGALLVLDEVASGLGRSGRMFACGREQVAPDLLCLAKGLTGGYLPMAATLATERVFQAFLGPSAEGRTFFHGHTYTGNALAAAAALATLDLFERERILEVLGPRIARLSAELERLRPLAAVGDIRQFGLAAGIELVQDRATRTPFLPAERRGVRVCRAARNHGVFLRPLGDTIVLMPPLSITESEITQLIDAVECGIRETCG